MLDKKYRWKCPVPNTGTDNDLKYRSHRALTWSYLPLPNGKVCKVGQTMAQWHNGGVLVGGKSRGSRPLVWIEAGSRIHAGSRLEAGGQGRLYR